MRRKLLLKDQGAKVWQQESSTYNRRRGRISELPDERSAAYTEKCAKTPAGSIAGV